MSKKGRYRMTPARRAALRKAQLASARRRRKQNFVRGAKVVGAVAGSIAVTAISANANRYLSNPRTAINDYRDVKNWAQSRKAKNKAAKVRINPTARRGSMYGPGHRPVRSMHHGQRIRSRVR